MNGNVDGKARPHLFPAPRARIFLFMSLPEYHVKTTGKEMLTTSAPAIV